VTGNLETRWRRLASQPRTVLLDGFHPVKHALRFGADVPLVVTADRAGMLALAGSLAPDLADRLGEAAVETDERTLRGLTGTRQHTNVAALARRPAPEPAPATAPTVLLIEPRHLGNVGAVVRVAAGLGAAAVLTTGTVDPWHPDAIRGSAGLHFAVPTRRIDDGELARLPGPLLAVDPAGRDAREQCIPAGAVLAFGSERVGVPAGIRRRADAVLAIPMRPGVSSYNLATSVAMLLYQWTFDPIGAR
jgi:RNA methyltransferase, TrmH family